MPPTSHPPGEGKPRGRRPRTLTGRQKAELVRLAGLAYGRSLACLAAGVGYRAFHGARRADPRFRADFDRADASARDPKVLAGRWAAAGGDRCLARSQATRHGRAEGARTAKGRLLRGVLRTGVVPRLAARRTVRAAVSFLLKRTPAEGRAELLEGLRRELASRPGLLRLEELDESGEAARERAAAEARSRQAEMKAELEPRRVALEAELRPRQAAIAADLAQRRAELEAKYGARLPGLMARLDRLVGPDRDGGP